MRRVLTALVLIPSVAYVIFLGPSLLFQLVVAAMALACFHEFAFIARAQGVPLPVWFGHAAGMVFLFAPGGDWRIVLLLALLMLTGAMRTPALKDALPLASAMLLGVVYVYGAWRCAPLLREQSPWWLFFAVSINWVGDSAAMYGGKLFGKHKLSPVISPGKTWEGAISSALFSTLYGAILLPRVIPAFGLAPAALLALAACVAGQVGDLAESALKRGAGVKDSGHMLPGHGGWLDRLDSTLFSMPVVAMYLSF
jgi:phosphatidate cytidylyltransferase